jgi:hypothetical protein
MKSDVKSSGFEKRNVAAAGMNKSCKAMAAKSRPCYGKEVSKKRDHHGRLKTYGSKYKV